MNPAKTYETTINDLRQNLAQQGMALHQSDRLYQLLVQLSPVGIFYADREGELLYVSDRWADLAGIEPKDALGHGWFSVVHVADRSQIFMAWQDAVKAQKPFEADFRILQGEQVFWVRMYVEVDRNPEGEGNGFIGALSDVTREKLQKENMKAAFQNLEKEVDARTKELRATNDFLLQEIFERKKIEAELIKSRTEAVTNTETKSRFLANMSHEIRTPMNGILNASGLLLQTDMNAEQREFVQMIHHSTRSLLDIINDILDLSRIESGKLMMDRISIDLGLILKDVITLLHESASKNGIELLVESSSQTPAYVIGDPTRIRQVLLNLVGNAIKFTHHGHVRIKLNYEELTDSWWRVCFEIQDTGIGMSEDQLGCLFKEFSQGDSSVTREYGGTGLGLFISQRLAEAMEGKIEATSQRGQGSTFKLTLPMKETQEKFLKTDTINPLEGYAFNKKVLLVEDNLINARLASKLMEKLGLHVSLAENGALALELLEQESFDLVFMDLQMPVMDGLAATKQLRKGNSPMQSIPIIAMTANVMESDRRDCKAAGMNGFLPKPLRIESLLEELKRWFPQESVS